MKIVNKFWVWYYLALLLVNFSNLIFCSIKDIDIIFILTTVANILAIIGIILNINFKKDESKI